MKTVAQSETAPMALWKGQGLTSTVSTSEEEKEGKEEGERREGRRRGKEGEGGKKEGGRGGKEEEREGDIIRVWYICYPSPTPQHLHGVRGRIVQSWYDPNNLDSLHEVCRFVVWGTEKHTMMSYSQWVYCERDE